MATHCQTTYGNKLGEGSVQQLMTQLHALQLTQLLETFFVLQKILFSATGTHRQIRTLTAQLVTNYPGDCELVTYPAMPDFTLLHRPAGFLARLSAVSFLSSRSQDVSSSWAFGSAYPTVAGHLFCFGFHQEAASPSHPPPSLQSHPVLQNWRTESSSSLDEMPTTTQTAQFAWRRTKKIYCVCVQPCDRQS